MALEDGPTDDKTPKAKTSRVLDLDTPKEEEEDSQLDTPKRMALGLMRPEDWAREEKKKRDQDNAVAEWAQEAEKKKKKDKVTCEDLPREPSKKLQGRVGPGPLVRLRTKSRDFYDHDDQAVTPNQPTKKPKSPSAESLLKCNYFVATICFYSRDVHMTQPCLCRLQRSYSQMSATWCEKWIIAIICAHFVFFERYKPPTQDGTASPVSVSPVAQVTPDGCMVRVPWFIQF